jgi:hypothetical protein
MKRSPNHAARHAPKPRLTLTQEAIDTGVQADSSHCMYQKVIEGQVPNARRVEVDLQTIAWTDVEAGIRYTYLTPGICQQNLVEFDQGHRDQIRPHEFTVTTLVHMRPVTRRPRPGNAPKPLPEQARLLAGESGDEPAEPRDYYPRQAPQFPVGENRKPVIVGGSPPPTAVLSTRRGRVRRFGLRQLQG